GHIVLISDTLSGVVRAVSAGAGTGDARVPGFSLAIAGALGHAAPDDGRPLVWRGAPADTNKATFARFPIHSATLLPDAWFADKIVLIGADLPDSDRHRTPYAAVFDPDLSNIPGVVIHAHALAQFLEGSERHVPSLIEETVSVLFMVALGIALAFAVWPQFLRLGAVGLFIIAWWVGAFWVFFSYALIFPVVMPSLGIAAAYGVGSAVVGGFYRRQQRHIRNAFEHYLAPAVVERLVEEGRIPEQGGEEREMTVWLSDLENYSTYSELLSPSELVDFLNTVYTVMADTIEEYNGFVAQFVGDAVVAAFGAPLDDPHHARNAIESVLACKERVEALNDEISLPGGLGLRNRYGVSTGPLLVGNIGSRRRLSYSIVGDDINLASRLEGVNKMYGSTIIVNEVTKGQCGEGILFRELDVVRVKGRDTPVRIFEPLGFEENVSEEQRAGLATFAEALAQYRAGRFDDSAELFESIAADDRVASVWCARVRALAADPPEADWEPINNLTTK
ncbi:MAG: adenylate/guanylate cyclase domain-containing protein, partial [Alphaproteobacteria bacterium]